MPFNASLGRALVVLLAATSPRVTEQIHTNDNLHPAGTLRDGVLHLRLDTRVGIWQPDGDDAPGAIGAGVRGGRASAPDPRSAHPRPRRHRRRPDRDELPPRQRAHTARPRVAPAAAWRSGQRASRPRHVARSPLPARRARYLLLLGHDHRPELAGAHRSGRATLRRHRRRRTRHDTPAAIAFSSSVNGPIRRRPRRIRTPSCGDCSSW